MLTVGGALLTPFCPVAGPAMIYAGLTSAGVSEATQLGGLIANEVVGN